MQSFPSEVIDKLKTYVYRLIDPRNGETFYVGKGKGNRVFAHIGAEIETDDPGEKLKRINEIRAVGFYVAHVIHRHGLDDKTAFEVEAALIDAYPGLTNAVNGSGSNEFGAMHAQEIVNKYQAVPAEFKHPANKVPPTRLNTPTVSGICKRTITYTEVADGALLKWNVILPRLGNVCCFSNQRSQPSTTNDLLLPFQFAIVATNC